MARITVEFESSAECRKAIDIIWGTFNCSFTVDRSIDATPPAFNVTIYGAPISELAKCGEILEKLATPAAKKPIAKSVEPPEKKPDAKSADPPEKKYTASKLTFWENFKGMIGKRIGSTFLFRTEKTDDDKTKLQMIELEKNVIIEEKHVEGIKSAPSEDPVSSIAPSPKVSTSKPPVIETPKAPIPETSIPAHVSFAPPIPEMPSSLPNNAIAQYRALRDDANRYPHDSPPQKLAHAKMCSLVDLMTPEQRSECGAITTKEYMLAIGDPATVHEYFVEVSREKPVWEGQSYSGHVRSREYMRATASVDMTDDQAKEVAKTFGEP